MNFRGLKRRLTAPIEDFRRLGDTVDTEHGPLTWIDRGGDVLAVAHLDYVLWNPKPKITRQYENVKIRKCPQLDDRLGAWMVLDVLPRAGIRCDVLLTDSEELGKSTAQFFQPPKQYNWLMQFDRAGSDAVMDAFEDDYSESLLEYYGYQVGSGSFTDICYLEHLECKGFNFGVGYHGQHTKKCYANLTETFNSFRKVQSMWKDCEDVHMPHDPNAPKKKKMNYWDWRHTSCSYPVSKVITRYPDDGNDAGRTPVEEGYEDQMEVDFSKADDDILNDVAMEWYNQPYDDLTDKCQDDCESELEAIRKENKELFGEEGPDRF